MTSLIHPPETVPEPSLLRTQVTLTDSQVHVALAGEMDLHTAPQLTAVVQELVEGGQARDIVLTLEDLSFCDVRGLTALLEAHLKVRSAGGRLTLTGVRGVVLRMATVSRLNTVFDMA